MNTLATHPSGKDWVAFILLIPVFAAMGALIPLFALISFAADPATGRPPAWSVALVLAVCAVAALPLVYTLIRRQYWRLTATHLIGGPRQNTRLPLSSIEKIIVGIPVEWPFPGLGKLASPLAREVFAFQKEMTLLVVFDDQHLLPLNLHALPNGTELMNALCYRFKDRLITNHTYTAEEANRLRHSDPNVLIKIRKKSAQR